MGNTTSSCGKQLKKIWETPKVNFILTDLWEIPEEDLDGRQVSATMGKGKTSHS
jgi:hypothetical protein